MSKFQVAAEKVRTTRPELCESLWYIAPGAAEIRCEPLGSADDNHVIVRALFSGISRGTERLIYEGGVPETEYQRMRSPFMAGAFPHPVKYGYASVGVVEEGPGALRGKTVFALYPHQSRYCVLADKVLVVPEGISPQRAVLAANMETALNGIWDAQPGPCDRIAVVGAGVVGCLVAWLCASIAGTQVTLVDIDPAKANAARTLGIAFALPYDAPTECDLVVHASATASGLATALRLAGEEATVLELSWYGKSEVAVPLGGAFHSRRLRIVSSQVGQVAASHRPRWSHRRRLAAALSLLTDDRLDALLSPAIPFADLPARLPDIFGQGGVPCPLISYADTHARR
jgi:NADPH:quinone reductase-like Zn-dependent oxidoreductase